MKTTNVGLGEWRVSRCANEVLSAIGLGSSIALAIYDPAQHVAGVAHVMLPSGIDSASSPVKYAETAVPFLLEKMAAVGVDPAHARAAIFGGAELLSTGGRLLLDIGSRNIAAARQAMEKAGLEPAIADVGGTVGRMVAIRVATGEATVKVLGQPDRVYAELAAGPEVHP